MLTFLTCFELKTLCSVKVKSDNDQHSDRFEDNEASYNEIRCVGVTGISVIAFLVMLVAVVFYLLG